MNWLDSKLGARDIDKVDSEDFQIGKIYYNNTQIGWVDHNSKLIKAIIFARNPLKKGRIFCIRIGKVKIAIYNYCTLSKLVEKHITDNMIGLQLLNIRLIWSKGLSKQEKERIVEDTRQWIASLENEAQYEM